MKKRTKGIASTMASWVWLLVMSLSTSLVLAGSKVTYLHNDHLGRTVMATDASANVVWQVEYRPFGEVEIITGDPAQARFFGFPGQYFDEESGLYYNYFRDYDPSLGRYLQSDPIGLEGGLNTYTYVSGNPIRYFDPYGLFQFGQRELGGLAEGSRNSNNLGIYHEHGFYQDGSGDNVGFFDSDDGGTVGPDPGYPANKHKYTLYPPVYDDARMRQAQDNVDSEKYDLFKNNCQDYADKLRREYQRLEEKEFFDKFFPNRPANYY